MNYDTMEAGREMDALVAEKVMGWKAWEETRGEYTHVVWQRPGDREPWYGSRDWQRHVGRYRPLVKYDPRRHIERGLSPFSTDISAAWKVVEKMGNFKLLRTDITRDHWFCEFNGGWGAYAPSAPLAICRAALKSKEGT
ncbi:hypothetical protein M0Q28_05840 [Patescibacteria group bacterium]|jgi:hypothetical protein|nr:hypothetical protein [Patescibacteria group bacterium]